MHKYRLIGKKGEGTFSEVLKAQCIKNGKYMAIKCMKNHFDSLDQVMPLNQIPLRFIMKNHFDSLDQVNNLREIQALRRLSPHPGIIKLAEVLYDQPTGRLALVFELMDMNIYELIRGRRHYLPEGRIKGYMYQLLKSMDHMHRNGIFHRDIKPENILITDDELKLADFGSCRGIYSKQPYTEYISTRWYRAPECLLTDGFYNYKMDMWGVGCVFFEVLSLYPLFPGTNELDQVTKIHNILGTPTGETLIKLKKHSNSHIDFNFPYKEGTPLHKLIPHSSTECVELITKLLAYDPDDRISARQAVKHPYFRDFREADKRAAQAQASKAQSSVSLASSLSAADSANEGVRGGGVSGAPALPGKGKAQKSDSGMLPSLAHGAQAGSSVDAGPSHHHRERKVSEPIYGAIGGGHHQIGGGHHHVGGGGGGLPSLHGHADQGSSDDGASSMLPPINSGIAGLKIDSRTLMKGGHQQHKPRQQAKAPAKKLSTGRALHGSGLAATARSFDKFGGEVPEFGVGNSSHHALQGAGPPMEAEVVGLKGSKHTKSYMSPYSQRFKK